MPNTDPQVLMQRADKAQYRAKDLSRTDSRPSTLAVEDAEAKIVPGAAGVKLPPPNRTGAVG